MDKSVGPVEPVLHEHPLQIRSKLAIAPTDGPLPLPGHWRWVSARALHLTFEDPLQQNCRLEVLDLTPDLLKVKVLQPR